MKSFNRIYRAFIKTGARLYLLLALLLLPGLRVQAQDKWELKKEADGIRIYTRSTPN
jgi:hypothetical protein